MRTHNLCALSGFHCPRQGKDSRPTSRTRLEIVNKFTYLGVVFTPGGSFAETQNMLAGQARKALFMLEKYTYKFTTLTTSHMISLFDKRILPILNYCFEVWGFIPANTIERLHLQFCEKTSRS